MHMLFLAIVIFLCFLVICRFMPFFAVAFIVLTALYLGGLIPPSDGFFSFALWACIIAMFVDVVVHIARMAGYGNTNDIHITR